jgi:hypothetical protein
VDKANGTAASRSCAGEPAVADERELVALFVRVETEFGGIGTVVNNDPQGECGRSFDGPMMAAIIEASLTSWANTREQHWLRGVEGAGGENPPMKNR